MVADVEHAVGRAAFGCGRGGLVQHAQHAFDNVVDPGEVALHVAVVEHVDGAAFEHGLGEREVGHVGPAPGPVHGEEAQAGGGQPVEVAVGVGHQLVGFLGGGVQTHRVVHRVALLERHLRVAAVHAGAGRVDQVPHALRAAAFQHVTEAGEVALEVGVRVGDGVTHTGLRCQVHHAVEALAREQRLHARAVGQVEPLEAKARLPLQLAEPGLLECRVVVIVEVVDAGDRVTARQQALRGVHADEAGRAGEQDVHPAIVVQVGGGSVGPQHGAASGLPVLVVARVHVLDAVALDLEGGRDHVVVHRPGRGHHHQALQLLVRIQRGVDRRAVLGERALQRGALVGVLRLLGRVGAQHADAQRLAQVGTGHHAGLHGLVHHQLVLDG